MILSWALFHGVAVGSAPGTGSVGDVFAVLVRSHESLIVAAACSSALSARSVKIGVDVPILVQLST
jgi:hypothetical protein